MGNAKKGILSGFLYKVTAIVMPFLVQTVLIHRMGLQFVGMQGVFRSILSVLSVAELGVGSAIVYSMYKPIAFDDTTTICALLSFYRKVYHWIGLVILLFGMAMMPFLKYIVDEQDVDVNIHLVFLLYLVNTVLSYFLYAYKTSLLTAFQRYDVISNVGVVISVCMSLLQILLLFLFQNFYYFLLAAILFTLIRNLTLSAIVDHLYPELRCAGSITGEMLKEIKIKAAGVLISKICGVSRNAFDNIFVSSFLGIVIAGIYSNYLYVMAAVMEIMSVISPALLGGIGNSIQLESRDRNYENMRKINCVYMLISGWCTVCMLCLYQPFMKVWAGADKLFSFDVVVLFSIYFFVRQMGNVRAIYSDAAGLFWENRYRNLAEAALNLILNYIFVIKFGVQGIVGATIISLFAFGYIGSSEVVFRCYFKKGMYAYLMDGFRYAVETALAAGLIYGICSMIPLTGFAELFIKLAICVIVAPVAIVGMGMLNRHDRIAMSWVYKTIFRRCK